jgi:non-ribosomal peptide synthetase component E (peptide arylation enzyme)
MELPNIPKEYLVFFLLLIMGLLAVLNIDTWTHATLGAITGYILGRDVVVTKNETLQSDNK